LYEELRIAATQLNVAYYGWRAGDLTAIEFENGPALRLHPTLNAGSVAIMHLFTFFSGWETWVDLLYGPQSFSFRYHNLFGDAWQRAASVGALLPAGLTQPEMTLPFRPGTDWSLTAGPHNAWNAGTPLGALDFAPVLIEERCAVSTAWVTASAPGVAVRARDNAVALDLDGDGDETTGWVIIYYHLAARGMVGEGVFLEQDQLIGHPSCEGGRSTGTHVHVARKFNGEWIPADGPVPWLMSGWRVQAGERVYAGKLVNGEQAVTADPSGRAGSTIRR
jgi:murein DD-endopeptidase MepM/ murein hydrolase activator NlpD